MSDAMTSMGLEEMRQAVEQLPAAVTTALRSVAMGTANRLQERAREILLSKSNAVKTAAAIVVVEDAPNQQFLVNSGPAAGDPKNVPIWLEHGTRHQAARAYMRPAADGAQEQYRTDIDAASVFAVEQVLG